MELFLGVTGFLVALLTHFRSGASKLVLLQTVCRHGDRAPIHVYPNYVNQNFWKYGLGRLTPRGIEQCYQNGINYRKHYKELFSASYDPYEVFIRTSNVDRTITSAESFAAGFFKETEYLSEKTGNSSKISPYPVHAISGEVDYYLSIRRDICTRLYEAEEDFYSSKGLTLLVARHQDFINFACEKAGYEMKDWNIDNIDHIFDTYICDKMNGKSTPEWLTEEVFANLSTISEDFRALALGDHDLLEFHAGAGPFLYLILENLRARVNMSNEITKFHLYYAHDTTLLGMLATLKYADLRGNPNYTSCINVELHQESDGKYAVDILYKYETGTMSTKRLVPSKCPSDGPCDWEVFQESMQTLVITDPKTACRPSDIVIQLNFTKSNLIVMTIGVSIFLLTLLTLVYSCGKSHQRTGGSKSHIDIQYEPMQFMDDI